MALGKQSKTINDKQAKAILYHLADARYPERNRVVFLLSIKAGMRSKEIANLTWAMVTDSDAKIADVIAVQNIVSKGKYGGREIPVHPDLKDALVDLQTHRGDLAASDRPVIYSERGEGMSANSVTVWFHRLYGGLGMEGCSSHSGRRTFVTKAAHKIVEAGGSLRDVQQLVGHSNLVTTQRYIEGSSDAKRKVIQMIWCPFGIPLSYVIRANLHRRHLTTSQRSAVAADLANIKLGGNQHSKEGTPIGAASEMLNVSSRSVDRAKKVKDADKKLFEKVKSGEVSVNAAVTSLKPVQSDIYRELRNDVP